MRHHRHPARWAALGAAVAFTLGAGGLGLVSATSPADAVVFVPLAEPCRAGDTRPGVHNVGAKTSPIGPGETHDVNVRDGECAGALPNGIDGVQLNVTALDATAATFLTIWAGGARPKASSLNPAPGQPPAPNAVTTAVTSSGDFNVFNRAGSVNVIVDIVGYYTDHHHDDRYYTKEHLDNLLSGEYVCSAAEFFPTSSNVDYGGSLLRYRGNAGADVFFVCGVHLPVGSVITGLTSYLNDYSDSAGSCSLIRNRISDGTTIAVATTDTTEGSSSAMQEVTATEFVEPTVLAGHGYRVSCTANFQLAISGAIVTYTVGGG